MESQQDENSLQIDPQLHQRIEQFARVTGDTPGGVVRKAFDEYEAGHNGVESADESEESVYDVLNRLGLIGCVKGGPSDLSTNPKYMEGFGRD